MAFPQLFAFPSSQARLLWLRQVPVPAGPSVSKAAAQPTQPSTCIPLPCVYTFSPSDPHRSAGSWWQESCSASAQLLLPVTARSSLREQPHSTQLLLILRGHIWQSFGKGWISHCGDMDCLSALDRGVFSKGESTRDAGHTLCLGTPLLW